MRLSGVQLLPIIVTATLQSALLAVLIVRKLRTRFPFFFNFVSFSLVSVAVRGAIFSHLSPDQCVYVTWLFLGSATILAFLAMHEAFANLLKPYEALVDLGRLLFRWAGVFLALVSMVTALAAANPETNKIIAGIDVFSRSCLLMQCGLLLLFLGFQHRLVLSWRSPAICIMLGFGANASMMLWSSFAQDHFSFWSPTLDWLTRAMGCVAVYGCWVAIFAVPQPVRRTVQESPARLIFQRWNEALLATPLVGSRSSATVTPQVESFLPGVEQTVERVLMARRMMD